MSYVDERIKHEFARLTRPIPLDGVLQQVGRRKTRRRMVRRLQGAFLAVVVVGGSATGAFVMTRVFAQGGVTILGGGPTTHPQGPGGPSDIACDDSQVWADVDGDGQLDQVDVLSQVISPDGTCAHSDAGQKYDLHISGGKYTTESPPFTKTRFYGAGGPLLECRQPFECQLFAVPDLSGDGAHEVAVQIANRDQMRSIVVYRWDANPSTGHTTRVAVAAPGDPWNDQYGLPPGPAKFFWGATPEAVRSVSCADRDGSPVVVVSTAIPASKGGYDVHRTFLRLDGETLTVVGTSDETVAEAPALPTDLCGAPIWKAGDVPTG